MRFQFINQSHTHAYRRHEIAVLTAINHLMILLYEVRLMSEFIYFSWYEF